MFYPQIIKEAHTFNLDDARELELYEALLNDPAIKIVNKKYSTQTETVGSGEEKTSTSQQYLYLEAERCSL